MRNYVYKAFITYSHEDSRIASWLQKNLESYRLPKKAAKRLSGANDTLRLKPIFRDREELSAGSDLPNTINAALGNSEYLIVICSPAAAKSRWTNLEIAEFRKSHDDSKILCLIVAGEPFAASMPGREGEECFPPQLGYGDKADADAGHSAIEPIAADIRPGKDGKNLAKLKIAAGLFGVGLDELARRDAQRRQLRLLGLSAVSISGMVIMAVLSAMAIDARSDEQARRAEAEDLVEFMLSDLRQRLEPVGRLDVLDSVGEKALSYYDAQDDSSLDADSLGRRARALHLIGEIEDIRGDSESALDTFRRAADSTRALLNRAPDDTQRIFDHSQSEFWVGYVAWQRGEYDAAVAAFEEYLRLAKQLVESDPANLKWQAELGFAHGNLGTMAYEQRRWQDAGRAFTNALTVAQLIVATDPGDPDLQHAVAINHSWLSSTYMSELRFADAREQNLAEIAIYESILEDDAQNRMAQRQLLLAKRGRAQLAVADGNIGLALQELRAAQTLIDELIELEPDATTNTEQQAMLQRELAEAYFYDGRYDDALQSIFLAIEKSDNLVIKDSTIIDWKIELARSRTLLGEIYLQQGEHALARSVFDEVRGSLGDLQQGGYDLVELPLSLGQVLLRLGDLEHAAGNAATAESYWLSARTELYGSDATLTPGRIMCLIETYLRLDKQQEANDLIALLAEGGYRHPALVRFSDLE